MKRSASALLLVCICAGLLYAACPKPQLNQYLPYSRAYLDRDGELLRLTLAEDQRYRLYRSLDDISPQFIEATLLYEDRNYYQHWGIDFPALLRAAWNTYAKRERRIGASTITMQVARLKWDIASSTIAGKLEQILRAIQLTRHYSKDEILEIYLNIAPYGRNIEGIGAASLVYFGKTADRLSLPEAMTLAVIPQNPGKRNPTSAAGYGQLLQARANLLQRWLASYPQDVDQLKYFSLPLKVRAPEALPFEAPHFVDFLERRLPRWDHGIMQTTLSSIRQTRLETLVTQYVQARATSGIHNAAALLLNYETMEIEAMLGSADFFDNSIQGQVNGTLAKRSPGSTLKPFVYALAMDDGLVHPLSLLRDSPRRFGGFTPENFDKRFLGPISVKQALIQSRNVPAVDLQARLVAKSFHRFLLDAGISGLRDEEFYGLALALGGGELSMLELVTLYAALANNGMLQSVKALQQEATAPATRILSPETSFLILDILKDNPAPHALPHLASAGQRNEIAWKTGTSWSFRDAWSIGVSGPYVLAVWIGNFDGQGNHSFTGRTAAGPLLFSLFDAVLTDPEWQVSDRLQQQSLNLKKLRVCATTGDLYEQDCPFATDSWFIPGVSPIKVSNVYRRIPIETETGLRGCWHKPGVTEMKVYEFWPSDYLQVFNQAGIMLKTPPKFSDNCSIDHKGGSGQVPIISSPQRNIEYVVSASTDADAKIPLEATVDPDVDQLYWFIDDRFVGIADRGDAFFWHAIPGQFEARVVDDAGRAASKKFVVSQIN